MVKILNKFRMLICKKNNLWLRVAFNFTYNHPITLLKFLECEYDTSDSNYLVKGL